MRISTFKAVQAMISTNWGWEYHGCCFSFTLRIATYNVWWEIYADKRAKLSNSGNLWIVNGSYASEGNKKTILLCNRWRWSSSQCTNQMVEYIQLELQEPRRFGNDIVLYSHRQHHNDTIINRRMQEDFYNNICTSHFICNVWKGYSRFACERELRTEQKLQYFDPYSYGRQRCVFLVLLMLNRRPWGPLFWVLAFFTASYQQLLWSPNSLGQVWLFHPRDPFRLLAIGMCHFLRVHHFVMACLLGPKVKIQQLLA